MRIVLFQNGLIHTFRFILIAIALNGATSRSVSNRGIRDVSETTSTGSTISGNQAKVCIVGDVVYGVDELVGSTNPCERCHCQPPGVVCEPIKCPPVISGCRVLQKPDQCCPLYQCECTQGNRTYTNGEKLEIDLNNPCKVCYCRGGVIQCANVSCYLRNDCEPIQVPGQCCPKYDNCPTRETITESNTNNATDAETELLVSWPDIATEITTLDSDTPTGNDELTITIKEVTKPHVDHGQNDDVKSSDITSSPDNVAPPKREIAPTSEKNEAIVVAIDDEKEQEEKEQDEKEQDEKHHVYHPQPVLKVGDQFIYLKKANSTTDTNFSHASGNIITVIGAEGLQRGEEEHEDDINGEFDKFTSDDDVIDSSSAYSLSTPSDSASSASSDVSSVSSSSSYSLSADPSDPSDCHFSNESNCSSFDPTSDLSQWTVEYSLPSEGPLTITSDDQSFNLFENQSFTNPDLNPELNPEFSPNSILNPSSSEEPFSSSVDSLETLYTLDQEDVQDQDIYEHNPAYPPLPEDILTINIEEALLNQKDDEFGLLTDYNTSVPVNPKNSGGDLVESLHNLSEEDRITTKILLSSEVTPDWLQNDTDSGRKSGVGLPVQWLKDNETLIDDSTTFGTVDGSLVDEQKHNLLDDAIDSVISTEGSTCFDDEPTPTESTMATEEQDKMDSQEVSHTVTEITERDNSKETLENQSGEEIGDADLDERNQVITSDSASIEQTSEEMNETERNSTTEKRLIDDVEVFKTTTKPMPGDDATEITPTVQVNEDTTVQNETVESGEVDKEVEIITTNLMTEKSMEDRSTQSVVSTKASTQAPTAQITELIEATKDPEAVNKVLEAIKELTATIKELSESSTPKTTTQQQSSQEQETTATPRTKTTENNIMKILDKFKSVNPFNPINAIKTQSNRASTNSPINPISSVTESTTVEDEERRKRKVEENDKNTIRKDKDDELIDQIKHRISSKFHFKESTESLEDSVLGVLKDFLNNYKKNQ